MNFKKDEIPKWFKHKEISYDKIKKYLYSRVTCDISECFIGCEGCLFSDKQRGLEFFLDMKYITKEEALDFALSGTIREFIRSGEWVI